HLHFTNDLARVIHNADAGLLDRNVQSRKMLHAALLLLMLEAAQRGPRFTISLKAQHPNSSAIYKLPADYPSLGQKRTLRPALAMSAMPLAGSTGRRNTRITLTKRSPNRLQDSRLPAMPKL